MGPPHAPSQDRCLPALWGVVEVQGPQLKHVRSLPLSRFGSNRLGFYRFCLVMVLFMFQTNQSRESFLSSKQQMISFCLSARGQWCCSMVLCFSQTAFKCGSNSSSSNQAKVDCLHGQPVSHSKRSAKCKCRKLLDLNTQ